MADLPQRVSYLYWTQIALVATAYLITDRRPDLDHPLETGLDCASAHVREALIEAIVDDRFAVSDRCPLCGELPLLAGEL